MEESVENLRSFVVLGASEPLVPGVRQFSSEVPLLRGELSVRSAVVVDCGERRR